MGCQTLVPESVNLSSLFFRRVVRSGYLFAPPRVHRAWTQTFLSFFLRALGHVTRLWFCGRHSFGRSSSRSSGIVIIIKPAEILREFFAFRGRTAVGLIAGNGSPADGVKVTAPAVDEVIKRLGFREGDDPARDRLENPFVGEDNLSFRADLR